MTTPWYETFFGRDYARFDEHPRTAEEIRFLRDVIPAEARVLDLACGMGRHSARLARAGYRVIGLDRSAELLARAPRRRVARRLGAHRGCQPSWVRADVRHVPLADGSCDAVISMFTSLGYFEDESENYRVLGEIARVLRPGGRLVIETTNRDFLMRYAPPQSWFERGGLVVLEERTFDAAASRSEVDVIVLEGAERRAYHHSIRLYTAAELGMLLASLAVDTLDVFGDFDMTPLTQDTPHMILIGERR